jgi:hypothetical protein
MLKNTPFVFEGNVTQQGCYLTKKGELLTWSVINITKIFRGDSRIKLGSIKVITDQGGNVGNRWDSPPSEGGVIISKGITYIIMGISADSSKLINNMVVTDNSLVLMVPECIQFTDPKIQKKNLKDFPAAQWGRTSFKNLDELYAYLKENGGLTVQEKAGQ